MALTSFDTTFDYTFARTQPEVLPVFPTVGGDGGGGIAGAVLPVSTNPGTLASCLHPGGQGWERWAGVPISQDNYLLPFILAVPMPGNVLTSPYCTSPVVVVDADSGAVIQTTDAVLHRLTDGATLYLIHGGTPLNPALPVGAYRVSVADAISEPFSVVACACLFRVRLLNDTRIGDLLYGSFGFQQVFYVEGELDGPTYEESETRSGTEKTGGSVKKSWTLTLEGVSEPIADALALSGLHRLVEVSPVNSSGVWQRSIQALAYEAKATITPGTSGGYDVSLKLPVGLSEWKTGTSADGSGCLTGVGSTAGPLIVVDCPVE